MNSALWVSKTGLAAQDMRMTTISNNLANVNTVGFKKDRVVFEDLFYQVQRQPGTQADELNQVPSGIQVGTGVRVNGTQKIFTDAPSTNEIKNLNKKIAKQENAYNAFQDKSNADGKTIPNVKGMSGMDAVALLENMKVKVKVIGFGKVKRQSIQPGQPLLNNTTIILELS